MNAALRLNYKNTIYMFGIHAMQWGSEIIFLTLISIYNNHENWGTDD